jgi:hypothetical protein
MVVGKRDEGNDDRGEERENQGREVVMHKEEEIERENEV